MIKAINISILLIITILSGCSIFKPVKTPVISTYELNTTPRHVQHRRTSKITLFISQPETKSVYNSTQIIYLTHPHKTNAFAVTEWTKTPSQMLEPMIVNTLHRTRYFKAVVTPPFAGNYDYALNTQIYKLLIDCTHSPEVLRLSVKAQIINTRTSNVIADKVFTLLEPIRRPLPVGGVIAANRATSKFLQRLVNFTLGAIH